jgi:hypothetical protein
MKTMILTMSSFSEALVEASANQHVYRNPSATQSTAKRSPTPSAILKSIWGGLVLVLKVPAGKEKIL